jgi:hypothetical protein
MQAFSLKSIPFAVILWHQRGHRGDWWQPVDGGLLKIGYLN